MCWMCIKCSQRRADFFPLIPTERKRHRPRKCRSTGPCEREQKPSSDAAADCQPPPEWLPQITSLQPRCFYRITLPCYWTWTLPINTNNEAAEHVKKNKHENKRKRKKRTDRAESRGILVKAFFLMLHIIACGFNVAAIYETTESEG